MVTSVKPQPGASTNQVTQSAKKSLKLIATTYANNTTSDYTEHIQELNKGFRYRDNQDDYWCRPEQSVLYGTPLYAEATPTQKIALNHIHWFTNYNYISDSETETVRFNQITASVFKQVGGHDDLVDELVLETEQEHFRQHPTDAGNLATDPLGPPPPDVNMWCAQTMKLRKPSKSTITLMPFGEWG